MRCYLDNDALHKLSGLGILSETLATLGVDDVRVLTTARYRFMVDRPEKGHARFGQAVWGRISAVIADRGRPLEGRP